MTITVNETRNEYTATASQTVFSYTFKIFADTDLNVYQTLSGNDEDDAADFITGYTVTGVGSEAGGTIILNTGAANGDLITIVSDIPEKRTTDYQSNGDFIPATVNNDFDRVVSLVKQHLSQRFLTFQESEQGASGIKIQKPQAGQALVWNDAADEVINGPSAADAVGASLVSEEQTATVGQTVFTLTGFTYTPNLGNIACYINGVKQAKSSYTETSSTVVTFSSGLDAGDLVEFVSGEVVTTAVQNASSVTYTPEGAGAIAINVQSKLREVISVSDFSSADAAALAAYTNDVPLALNSGETAKLVCDPTGGDDIQGMVAWMRQCYISGDATFYLELADGVHTISTYIDINGEGLDVDIRGSSSPDQIQISSYSYSSVSGTIYNCSVVVASALPAGAVVGGPIGIQNAQGTLDCASANGCQIIKAIAGDRLSFTFDFFSPVGFPSNGVLDNTLTNGLTANQAVIFKGSLICQNTGWDGSSREGFLNAINGGRCTLRNFGMAYSGASATEHDLVFTKGSGSRVYAYDRMGFAGAGDKVLRSYGGAEFHVNRSYLGGAGLALELFQGVAGGFNQFVRTSSGGASTAGFTCGHASFVNFAQATLTSCGIGFRVTTLGATISAYPSNIHKCTTGMLATAGEIYGTSDTTLTRNTLGVDWAGSGIVTGNFGLDSNASDSVALGNVMYNGGIWNQNTALNPKFTDLTLEGTSPILSLIDGATTSKVDGNSGNVSLVTHSTSRDILFKTATTNIGAIDGSTGIGAFFNRVYPGSVTVNTALPFLASGSGTPEGVVAAPIGSIYMRTDGGAGTSYYVKESGTGNTGWVAK